jgi:signal transduction histidine kinase
VNTSAYVLVGLTAVVAALVGLITFALLRFSAAARDATRHIHAGPSEPALMSSALQEAVSALKAREQAMAVRATASEALAGRVFDSLTAGLIVVGDDGQVRIANPAACRMLSLAPPEAGVAVGAWLGDSPFTSVIDDARSGQSIARRAVRLEGADGVRHFGVTVSPLGDPATEGGVICLFSDLTAVVDLERQLQLKEALARLGEMSAGIAHEIRNGLATIHGYSRLINLDALQAPHRTYVEGIRQETDTLGRIVTNFLGFARPEQIAMSEVDLRAVIGRAVDDLEIELPPRTNVALDGTFGAIVGDEVMLRQVFGNLVRNAAEACTAAGTAPEVTITGEVDLRQRAATVAVDDNGPGIPAADRARVFQPFFTTRSRGSGLGLAIVQKIVLLHNGTVAVGSSPAGGAQIQVVFPLIQA